MRSAKLVRPAIALAVVASASLTGCSSSSQHPSSSPMPTTPKQTYLTALRGAALSEGGMGSYTDAQLVSAGRLACNVLAHPEQQNFSANPIDDLVHAGWNTGPAAAIVRAAKLTLCKNGGN